MVSVMVPTSSATVISSFEKYNSGSTEKNMTKLNGKLANFSDRFPKSTMVPCSRFLRSFGCNGHINGHIKIFNGYFKVGTSNHLHAM